MIVHSPGTVAATNDACTHNWTFTTPNHIRCTSCPAIGQRWPSRAERAEFKRGGWIYLKPRQHK